MAQVVLEGCDAKAVVEVCGCFGVGRQWKSPPMRFISSIVGSRPWAWMFSVPGSETASGAMHACQRKSAGTGPKNQEPGLVLADGCPFLVVGDEVVQVRRDASLGSGGHSGVRDELGRLLEVGEAGVMDGDLP